VLTSDFAKFEEEDGLTEDVGQVGAIDLVEDKEGSPVLRQPRGFDEPAGPNTEPEAFPPGRPMTVLPRSPRRSRRDGSWSRPRRPVPSGARRRRWPELVRTPSLGERPAFALRATAGMAPVQAANSMRLPLPEVGNQTRPVSP
jgi:hypothetical protein